MFIFTNIHVTIDFSIHPLKASRSKRHSVISTSIESNQRKPIESQSHLTPNDRFSLPPPLSADSLQPPSLPPLPTTTLNVLSNLPPPLPPSSFTSPPPLTLPSPPSPQSSSSIAPTIAKYRALNDTLLQECQSKDLEIKSLKYRILELEARTASPKNPNSTPIEEIKTPSKSSSLTASLRAAASALKSSVKREEREEGLESRNGSEGGDVRSRGGSGDVTPLGES